LPGSRSDVRVAHATRKSGYWYLLVEPVAPNAPLGSHWWVTVYDDGTVKCEGGR
jgi:hypothetical protein